MAFIENRRVYLTWRLRSFWLEHWRNQLRAWRRKLLVPFEWAGIGLAALIFTTLSHRWLFRICDFASIVMYHFDRRGRSRSLENLRIVYNRCTGDEGTVKFDPDFAPYNPTRAEELIIRCSYRNMARTIGHIFWTFRKAARRAAAVGELSPECKEFLSVNRPAITVSAHMGCWEILSQLAFLEGHEMISVAKKIGTNGMTRMLMRARKSIGQEIVGADGAFKPLMAGIKAGKSLGLLVDQAVQPKHGGIFVRFFGKPISVSSAPAFFAIKTKQPIIVAWSRPLKNLHYRCERISIYEPDGHSIWELTQSITRDLERIIRRHPSCWVLNYNFFSNVPTPEDLDALAKRESAVKDENA